MKGFVNFIREQGVVGLAIGFIMGGAVSKVVTSLVNDIISPVIGLALGKLGNLKDAAVTLGPVKIAWGSFVSTTIDFIIIAAVIYVGFRVLRLEKLDKKKEPAPPLGK
jgi:large conductance mechanosensitive channel